MLLLNSTARNMQVTLKKIYSLLAKEHPMNPVQQKIMLQIVLYLWSWSNCFKTTENRNVKIRRFQNNVCSFISVSILCCLQLRAQTRKISFSICTAASRYENGIRYILNFLHAECLNLVYFHRTLGNLQKVLHVS